MSGPLTDNPQKLLISLLLPRCEYEKKRPRLTDCLNFKRQKHCPISNLIRLSNSPMQIPSFVALLRLKASFKRSLGGQVTPPKRRGKPLDGVAKHRPRHAASVTPQELFLDRAIALPDFPEHPAYCFVNEVVRIIEQKPRDAESRVKMTALYVLEGCHDRDASFPQQARFGQPPQIGPITLAQVGADDVRCRTVDQIPIVNPKRTTHVETIDRITAPGVSASVLLNQNEQGEKSLFVPRRFKQRGDVAERECLILASELAKHRHTDSEESITSPVLTSPRLEEAPKHRGMRRATKGFHTAMNGRYGDGLRNILWHYS
jgi:hypothetical protein